MHEITGQLIVDWRQHNGFNTQKFHASLYCQEEQIIHNKIIIVLKMISRLQLEWLAAALKLLEI